MYDNTNGSFLPHNIHVVRNDGQRDVYGAVTGDGLSGGRMDLSQDGQRRTVDEMMAGIFSKMIQKGVGGARRMLKRWESNPGRKRQKRGQNPNLRR